MDKQRGKHVYVESIEVIKRLNAVGFGVADDLALDLVYNPGGPSLPPAQEQLEADYRRELDRQFGILSSRMYAGYAMSQLNPEPGQRAVVRRFRHKRDISADAGWRG